MKNVYRLRKSNALPQTSSPNIDLVHQFTMTLECFNDQLLCSQNLSDA